MLTQVIQDGDALLSFTHTFSMCVVHEVVFLAMAQSYPLTCTCELCSLDQARYSIFLAHVCALKHGNGYGRIS